MELVLLVHLIPLTPMIPLVLLLTGNRPLVASKEVNNSKKLKKINKSVEIVPYQKSPVFLRI